MRRKFLPHQLDAWRYAKDRPSIELFMHMRLGKTLVAIRWAEQRTKSSDGRVLISAPLSTFRGWVDECNSEGHYLTICSGQSRDKLRKAEIGRRDGNQWFITNPEGILACPELVTAINPNVFIVDESAFLRNDSKTTKLFLKLSKDIPYLGVLCGLPNPEGPEDFFNQCLFTRGEFMGCTRKWDWLFKWFNKIGFEWAPKRNVFSKIKKEVAENAFVLTAEEAGCFMPKVYEQRWIKPPAKIRRVYNEVRQDFACGHALTKWALVAQTWLGQIAAGHMPEEFSYDKQSYSIDYKQSEIKQLLSTELRGQNVVLFSRWTKTLQQSLQTAKKLGLSAKVLQGSTPVEERMKAIRQFQKKQLKVLIVQESKVGEKGIDLSAANVMVFIDSVWSWETRAQCEMRCDHPLKKEAVLVIDLIAEGTIEESVYEALQEKKRNQKSFLRRVFQLAKRRELG